MKKVAAVILAAGKGTRMKSALPKVVHEVSGLPLVVHLIRQVRSLGIKDIVVVVGHEKDVVIDRVSKEKVAIVEQKEQLGTGHALRMCKKALASFSGDILVLGGDTYFENSETLQSFCTYHKRNAYDMSVLTAQLDNPFGYGRIIRNPEKDVVAIREEVDAVTEERLIREINTGIYLFNKDKVFATLKKVRTDNKKKEYYLTSAVALFVAAKHRVGGFLSDPVYAILGVNDRVQLADIQKIVNRSIIMAHQRRGVTVIDPDSTYIEVDVTIGSDSIIYPFTYIEKNVSIGSGCAIGPFCKIRSDSTVKDTSNIGSFVEVVRSKVGSHTNIKHLSYIGDATVGNRVNIGAGTITANYDGVHKHKTVIGDGSFIGSDTVLIAPITVGKGARTGAGAVVPGRRNIPAKQIAVGVPAKIVSAQKKVKTQKAVRQKKG